MHNFFNLISKTIAICIVLGSTPTVWGANGNWLGGNNNNDLTTPANWSSGTVPSGLDTGFFINTGTTTPNLTITSLSPSFAPASLNFAAGAQAYNITVSGAGVSLGFQGIGTAAGTNVSGNVQNFFSNSGGGINFTQNALPGSTNTINYNAGTSAGGGASTAGTLLFLGNYTDPNFTNINLANGSTCIISGVSQTLSINSLTSDATSTVSLGSGTLSINFSGATPIAINGPLTGATGSLTKNGTGTLFISNTSNTFGGGINISAGKLVASPPNAVPTGDLVTNNAIFELDGPGTFNAPITGTGAVTINTLGGALSTVVFNGAHSYSGGTTITSGTLQVNALTSLPGSALQGVVDNGTLDFNILANGTYNGPISGTGGIQLEGGAGNTLILAQPVTYTGPTLVNSGTLQINSFTTISGTTTLSSASSGIDYNLAGSGTVSGQITGSGFVDINDAGGTGTVTFTNSNNNYTGGTTVNAGKLIVSPASALPGNVTNNAAIELDGAATFAGSISGPGSVTINTTGGTGTTVIYSGLNSYTGGTTISSGTLQSPVSSMPTSGAVTDNATFDLEQTASTTGTFTGVISGTGSVVINGAGDTGIVVLTPTSPNTYTGVASPASATTVANGILRLGNIGAVPGTSTIGILINAPGTVDFPLTGTYGGPISGAGGVTVEAGVGTLILSQPATYTGTTLVNTGTLELDNQTTFASAVTIASGTEIDFNQTIATPASVSGKITGAGQVFINGNGGTGTVTLTNTANNYTGGTTVSGGTLAVTAIGAVPGVPGTGIVDNGTVDFQTSGTYNGPISGTGGISVEAGAGNTLILNQPVTYTGTTAVNTGTLQLNNITTFASNTTVASGTLIDFNQLLGTGTVSGSISGAGGVLINGAGGTGTIILTNGANTYSGGTKVSAGTLQINNISAVPGVPGTGIVDNGIVDFVTFGTYNGPISGTGNLIVGAGVGNTLILTQPATYAGSTTVNSGTFELDNQTTFSSPVTLVSSSIAIDFNQTIATAATVSSQITGPGALLINGNSGTGKIIFTNTTSTFTGGTTISGGTLQTTVSLPGNVVDNGILDFEQAAGTTGPFAGAISGTGSVQINAAGATGTVILSNAANSYAGGTTVANGTLQINNLTGVPGNIAINSPGTLVFNQTVDGTFSNQVTGAGTIHKIGGAKLTFGVNESSFTGTTIVSNGELKVNNILGGNVIVRGIGKLSGIGTVLGNVEVRESGKIHPGNSIGTFHINGNFRQRGDSTYEVETVFQPDFSLQASLIEVGGIATLDPLDHEHVRALVSGLPGQLPVDQTVSVPILHASGGVFGKYAFATADNPLVTPFLTYDSTHVFLNFINTLAVVPVTFNEKQVAQQLQSITNPTPAEQAILIGITSLPAAQANAVLDEMSGEQYTSILLGAEFANREFLRRLYDPLRLIITSPYCVTKECCPEDDLRLDTWFEGSGHQVFLRPGFNSHSVTISGYEVGVGTQLTFNGDFTAGVAFSYQVDHFRYHVGGSGKSSTSLGGLYGLYRPCDYYILGDFIFGYGHNKIRRDITIGTLNFQPHSSPKVSQTGYYVEAGKDFFWRFLLAQPFIALEGGFFRFNQIEEKGGEPLNLTIDKKSISPTYTRLGLHLTTRNRPLWWSFGADFSWAYRLTSFGTNINEQFQSFGTPFFIKGQHLPRSFFEVGGNFSVQLCNTNWELFGEVTSQIWTNALNYSVVAGVNASW